MTAVYYRIIQYIDTHIKDEISITEIADMVGYSANHVYKLFKVYSSQPIMEYIRRKKIQAAAAEMHTGRKLYEIALDCGYQTPAGFYKAFQSVFGRSPSDYKNDTSIKAIIDAKVIREKIQKLTEEIELDPNNADLYGKRGYEYSVLGQHEEAIENFNKSLELDLDYVWGYIHRIWSYTQLGRYDKAIEDYEKAFEFIEFRPNLAWSYRYRGVEYAVMNRHDKAIECYDKSLEIDPEDARTYYRRAWSYAQLGQRDKAVKDYGKTLELDRDNADARKNLDELTSL